jgi:hypothetical protein
MCHLKNTPPGDYALGGVRAAFTSMGVSVDWGDGLRHQPNGPSLMPADN